MKKGISTIHTLPLRNFNQLNNPHRVLKPNYPMYFKIKRHANYIK